MASSQNLSESANHSDEAPPIKKRRWLKFLLLFVVLAGAGCALAMHFLKEQNQSTPIVDYEEANVNQAAAKESAAKSQVEKDQENLKKAQTAHKNAKAKWEEAKEQLETAKQNTNTATARQEVKEAEQLVDTAKEQLDQAEAELKIAEDKLKTDDQLLAEAEAERERIAKQATQEAAFRKALLGVWTRSASYGKIRLELKTDGTGLMTIFFNRTEAFLLGTDKMDVDITWKVTGGDHMIFDSIRGRPEKTFEYVSKLRGTHRDQVLMKIDEKNFTAHEADDKTEIRTWTRVESE